MKTRGGRKQGVGKGKNPTSTSGEDVPEEEQEQVHDPPYEDRESGNIQM